MAVPAPIERMIAAEREQHEREIERLRGLSDRERGEMILSVCHTATMIYAGRIESGLPPMTRDSWPESTWEFLRKHAPNGKST
jgi:hypothetical protein